MALAADHFDKGINNRGKSVRINPTRFKGRKSFARKFDLSLNQIVGINAAFSKHAFGAISPRLNRLTVEEPEHEINIVCSQEVNRGLLAGPIDHLRRNMDGVVL